MFWLGNLWASIVEWAWILLAVTAALGFIVSFFAGILPFAWLKAYSKAIHVLAILAAVTSAAIWGSASSSAHARLKETQHQLEEARAANFRQAAEIERRKRIAAENDAALVRLAEKLITAETEAAEARAEQYRLEKEDADVATYLDRDVPPALRGVLVKPRRKGR